MAKIWYRRPQTKKNPPAFLLSGFYSLAIDFT